MSLTKQKKTIDSYITLKMQTKDSETQKLVKVAYSRFDIFCQKNFSKSGDAIIDEMAISIKSDDEPVFEILQEAINWLYKKHQIMRKVTRNGRQFTEPFMVQYSARSLRTWFTNLRGYLYYRKVKLDDLGVRHNLNFPKPKKEKLYALTKSNIDRIFDAANRKQKNFYLALISSGMRDGEALQIRKKDLFLEGKRVKINIPASVAKKGVERTTFISFEAWAPIREQVESMGPDGKVWGSDGSIPKNDQREKIRDYGELIDGIGLGMKYESTGRRKITLHTFRSYFITKGNKVEDGLGHALAGHGKYMGEYERYSDEELEELYINGLERFVLVYDKNIATKKIEELERQTGTIQKMESKLKVNTEDSRKSKQKITILERELKEIKKQLKSR